ncbi:L-lactate dehydrogenase [Clostridium oryzae]|uniref:L-lactate dehydrogenase n=1 Tax=Clostridium oryzae TaxID=1450648 RepID=A0A1V4I4Q4_9CLOT|nr:L-lactate dehydrogenase [Clostridium oryzae]OPJ54952.1 L-lactate dehydrogenase [Clostridium oryzae]
MKVKHGKLVIIGAGKVGSAILNSILRMNVVNDIVVINRNRDKALGEVLDASHTTAFAYSANASIRVGDYEDCADAQIIVMTAGPSIKPGNSRDRMVLLEQNIAIMSDVMSKIVKYTTEAIIINVSNPLDILVYVAQKKFNYPKDKILGTGTLLDTARFNKILGDICGVDAKNVTGFVLGEHGATSFIPWNTVNIVGISFHNFEKQFKLTEKINKNKILEEMKTVGLDIVELKGYTSSGVALSACRLVAAIMRNEKCIVPVSVVLDGQYGITDVALSLPCVISENGIDKILEIPLDEQGTSDFQHCVSHLKEVLENCCYSPSQTTVTLPRKTTVCRKKTSTTVKMTMVFVF